MKKLIIGVLVVCFIFMSSFCYAASNVTFGWEANIEQDLAGYKLYQSDVSGNYDFNNPVATIDDPNAVEYKLLNVPDGVHYWVLTAYDSHDNQSGPSNEVTDDLDTVAPANPSGCFIKETEKIN